MKINLIELPYYPDNLLHLFESLSQTPWSMLLYSGHNNQHPDSRFDILVTKPVLTFITRNNITTISNNKTLKISYQDPFTILQKYTQTNNHLQLHHNNNVDIPFQGGFVGVFGYDLIRHIESLPKLAKQDTYLPDMAIGLYKWAIISDHKLCKNYLVTHDSPDPILSWIRHCNHRNCDYKDSFQLLNVWTSNINYTEYIKKFNIIKKHLISGNCYQICFSQRFKAPYSGNEWIAFRYLLEYNQAPFSAFIRLPNQSSILSFSPERFIQCNHSNIKTQPIKGTLPRLKNVQDDKSQVSKLFVSTKNRSENLMIVDLLRNDIGKVAIPGSIQVSKLFEIQSFQRVHHMVSTIQGKLDNNFSIYDLLRSCFPGGSITGAPKIQAMKFIEELEPHRRNIWSGCIGYISNCGKMDTNIIIRTLLTENQYIFCSVGSGIVLDSNAKLEYEEMQNKISTLTIPLFKRFYLK